MAKCPTVRRRRADSRNPRSARHMLAPYLLENARRGRLQLCDIRRSQLNPYDLNCRPCASPPSRRRSENWTGSSITWAASRLPWPIPIPSPTAAIVARRVAEPPECGAISHGADGGLAPLQTFLKPPPNAQALDLRPIAVTTWEISACWKEAARTTYVHAERGSIVYKRIGRGTYASGCLSRWLVHGARRKKPASE